MKRATIADVLEFFYKQEVVIPLDLMNRFNYPRGSADWMLLFLKRRGFIVRESRGQYTITNYGVSKLIQSGRVTWQMTKEQ